LQMRGEELLQALPGVLRRRGLIRAALVAEEAVIGARVHHDLDLLPVLLRLGLERLDALERDERVLLAEEGEDGAAELHGLVDRNAAAVERHGRADLVGEL